MLTELLEGRGAGVNEVSEAWAELAELPAEVVAPVRALVESRQAVVEQMRSIEAPTVGEEVEGLVGLRVVMSTPEVVAAVEQVGTLVEGCR